MPDKRKHRGPHPRDRHLFADDRLSTLRTAVSELSWLLTRGYAADSALKLVGDRHQLVARQRTAVQRATASDEAVARRASQELTLRDVEDGLAIDGFNLIVTIEAALSGGMLLKCRDGAIRDLASVHGSYRRVEETMTAVERIAATLDEVPDLRVHWFFDSPVSNSGRLATTLRDFADQTGRRWEVELIRDVDKVLRKSRHAVVTSDSVILDAKVRWLNLAERVVVDLEKPAWIVDLRS